MRSESEISHSLEEFIRDHGAMSSIRSDNAKAEVNSIAMRDLLRLYAIGDSQSEAYYQHQNPIERRIQDVKRISQNIMDRTGCPAKCWLLCVLYVIGLLNHVVCSNGTIPNSIFHNVVTDVSLYLSYHFWQPVFFEDH